ncbi:MAG TPA: hypothetical protein PLU22_14055 [Polyangiaceae bacterium]|nr:hypothetical protein [Polyangiaceae bacterium]
MRRLHATGPSTVLHHPRARLHAGLTVLGAALGALGLAACGEPTSLGDVTSDPATGGTDSSPTEEGGATGDAGAPASDALPDVFEPEAQARSEQLDLLFVIDNSISMADKQELLREAVPKLVERLIDPYCKDQSGSLTPKSRGVCPAGTEEEMSPVRDMHIGVISSSLGGHGGIACTPAEGTTYVPEKDDRGELIAPLRGATSFEDRGFLAWDTRSENHRVPGTTNNLPTLVADLEALVAATGETGCAYEAPLEAMYRFLVDPEPPIQVINNGYESVRDGINTTLLEQRAAFLRPDSALAVVMLTDENDCSVLDEGPGIYVAGVTTDSTLPRGTAACVSDPNDHCCRSCALAESSPPDGCEELSRDPSCMAEAFTPREEHANLRCFEQKRRFGIDLLYPTERYVRGLTRPTIVRDRDHAEVDNPLFAGGRDPSLVTLVGIVGVPWQLLARSQSEELPLRFKPAAQLHQEGLWPAIVGRPAAYEPPLDPFMVESIEPRTALDPNLVTGLAPEPPDAVAGASPVNGHEYVVTDGGDLQYACTFPLPQPRECTDSVTGGCDCKAADSNLATKPLCQAPGSTASDITQYSAKAYPGLRQLEVMRRLGPLAVPASICPRVTDDPSDPSYGYHPVTESLLDRLRGVLLSP